MTNRKPSTRDLYLKLLTCAASALCVALLLPVTAPAASLPSSSSADVNQVLSAAKVPTSAKFTAGLSYAGAQIGNLQPFNLNLRGTYNGYKKEKLPEFDATAQLTTSSATAAVGATYVNGKFYFTIGGQPYVANQSRTDKVTARLTKLLQSSQIEPTFGVVPLDLLKNPQIVRTVVVDGVKAYEITAEIDIAKIFDSLHTVLNKVKAVLPTKATGNAIKKVESRLDQLETAIQTPQMELFVGVQDSLLRKRILTTNVVDPNNAAATGTFVLKTSFTGANKQQSINEPENAKPLSTKS